MSVLALSVVTDIPSPAYGSLGATDHISLLRESQAPPSDSSRSTSPIKRRTVRWNRSKYSREPSHTDGSNNDLVELDEQDFPLSHTRTSPQEADELDSDCEIGYHSDTAIDIRLSGVITLQRALFAHQSRFRIQREDNEHVQTAHNHSIAPIDVPRHNYSRDHFGSHRPRHYVQEVESDDEDVEMQSQSGPPDEEDDQDEEEDLDEEDAESEYEAPVLRKRKRKLELMNGSSSGRSSRGPQGSYKGARSKLIASGTSSSVGTPDISDIHDIIPIKPPTKKGNTHHHHRRGGFGKRPRVDLEGGDSELGKSGIQRSASANAVLNSSSSIPAVLEFPCPYVSPEGRACTKKFPRWTDYEKHYESFHTGDSGYPWSYKVEAKDCPFRCPHPIPSASRPKSNKGRLVKTVEYGPCDFVTRKNTHDFERHWKGNHIRSEALFIARGNMQLEEAKWVNMKEKFEIAYALCPRCPRCSENFTRTDALTRHLRSPCSGGSVGAAVEENHITAQQAYQQHVLQQQQKQIQHQIVIHDQSIYQAAAPEKPPRFEMKDSRAFHDVMREHDTSIVMQQAFHPKGISV